MTTPEGKVKKKVKDKLSAYFGNRWKALWPVLNGMGAPALDCHGCLNGWHVLVETKRDDGLPFIDWDDQFLKATPRQQNTIKEFAAAGSKWFVVDSDLAIDAMIEELVKLPCRS